MPPYLIHHFKKSLELTFSVDSFCWIHVYMQRILFSPYHWISWNSTCDKSMIAKTPGKWVKFWAMREIREWVRFSEQCIVTLLFWNSAPSTFQVEVEGIIMREFPDLKMKIRFSYILDRKVIINQLEKHVGCRISRWSNILIDLKNIYAIKSFLAMWFSLDQRKWKTVITVVQKSSASVQF